MSLFLFILSWFWATQDLHTSLSGVTLILSLFIFVRSRPHCLQFFGMVLSYRFPLPRHAPHLMRLVVLGPFARGSWALTFPVPPQFPQSPFAMFVLIGCCWGVVSSGFGGWVGCLRIRCSGWVG